MENNYTKIKEKKEIFAVLDIGTTKIVYLVSEKIGNEFKILGYAEVSSVGMRRGEIVNVSETTKKIKSVISEVEEKLDIIPQEVVVGIAGFNLETKIISESLSLNPDKPIDKDIIEKLENEIKLAASDPDVNELLDYFPKDFIIRDINGREESVLSPVGLFGKKIIGNYHIILVKKTIKKHIESCILSSGKKIKSYILEPLASAESTLNDVEKEVGVIMIDIGGGTSDLIVFKDKKIVYTVVNPIGSVDISVSLKKIFSISELEAEKLKIKYGSCWLEKVKDKNQIITIGSEDEQIQKSKIRIEDLVINIASTVSEKIIKPLLGSMKKVNISLIDYKNIVITGGGAQLRDLKDLISYLTGLNARLGHINDEYDVGGIKIVIEKELKKPKYATLIGMLIYSLKKNMDVPYQDKKREISVKEDDKEVSENDKKIKKSFFGKMKEGLLGIIEDIN